MGSLVHLHKSLSVPAAPNSSSATLALAPLSQLVPPALQQRALYANTQLCLTPLTPLPPL